MTKKRKFVSQKDIPSRTLNDALKVPAAIFENYAGDPTEPIDVAAILGQAPKGTAFRMVTGAAIAYGLIDGGAQSETIAVTDLSVKIFRPTNDGQDIMAKREAFLKPRVINEFMVKYDKSPIPTIQIAINVIEKIGVPRERAEEVFNTILAGAKELGLVKEINGKTYIRLKADGLQESSISNDKDVTQSFAEDIPVDNKNHIDTLNPLSANETTLAANDPITTSTNTVDDLKAKRVFITHGKNKALVAVIKRFLSFGELEPVVSVEEETTSIPVPEKVMSDMRSCGAAIIHVTDEEKLATMAGEERIVLNQNVLIEIGAAMALYGNRFILLIKRGVALPSNLQGLYRVEYDGDDLGSEGTMKLLSAIESLKKMPLTKY